MKHWIKRMMAAGLLLAGTTTAFCEDAPLPAPPQDQGLPYTRSARPAAREAIGSNLVFYPGSRYAYVAGYRTRLDAGDPLHGEAIEKDGKLYVPASFAGLVLADPAAIKADEAPAYLADRFVHTLQAPAADLPEVGELTYKGKRYLSVEDLAKAAGKPVAKHPNGLVVIGEAALGFFNNDVLSKAVVTLFDTPDTLADPDIATEYIPLLKRQGPWTKWVKHTPEQLAMLEGPETEWPMVPREQYNFEGFDPKMLGSAVPPPGVFPRLLFSPGDLPMLRQRLKTDAVMAYSYAEMEALLKTTWFDPQTDDGKMFERLANGEPIRLEEISETDRKRPVPLPFGALDGYKGGIATSHIPYIGHCLVAIQLYALIEDDKELGRKAAAAAVNWCELLERGVDRLYAMSDSEFGTDYTMANGGETAFRLMAGADHMNLPFLLDFGGKWMTGEQKKSIARLIAKVTYGRADSHSAGSMRWQENNHSTWHTTILLGQMEIEGMEGHDPENFPRAVRTLQAFSEFGIDPEGVVFESNGKSGAGFRNALLNMVAVARRGENFFGHPHWRNLATAQAQCTSPGGTVTVTSGTYAGVLFDAQCLMFLKAFYPEDRSIDWLLGKQNAGLDVSAEGRRVHYENLLAGKRGSTRLPIFTAPLSPRGTLYDTDFKSVRREDLKLPLVFSAPVHGMFSASSDPTEDAAWINLLVRENGYLGAGHQHADSGMFHFSALGVNWLQESPLNGYYDGNLHNLVLIDGRSTPDTTAPPGRYLGYTDSPRWAFASADLKPAYDHKWVQQVIQWDEASWWAKTPLSEQGIEFEDHPNVIAAFKGTQHYKMRNWWPSYTFGNWIPTVRAAWNPVEYAKRGVALVRGQHPYGMVIDKVKKDDQVRHYEWTACPGRGVWKTDYETAVAPLPPNQIVLGYAGPKTAANHKDQPEPLVTKDGYPLLLVCVLNEQAPLAGKPLVEVITREGPVNPRSKKPDDYDNLVVHHQGTSAEFKVLLIPFRRGEALPEITYDKATATARVRWADQVDEWKFDTSPDGVGAQLKEAKNSAGPA